MKKLIVAIIALSLTSISFSQMSEPVEKKEDFKYLLEQFADLKIMRYQVPGFDELTLKQKELIYYLSQAAIAGRDILFDQNYKHNLAIRRTLENIIANYEGDRSTEDFTKLLTYTKRVWFSNGIHHHYSKDKFIPEVSPEYFAEVVRNTAGNSFPIQNGQTIDDFINEITPIIFDPNIAPKGISQEAGKDLVTYSATNFYEGVTEEEVLAYYDGVKKRIASNGGDTLISLGLNSKVIKQNGQVIEQVYKKGGLYTGAIEQIIYWLDKAANVAENQHQEQVIRKLIEYYETGNLSTWDQYNVLWVQDLDSQVDFVNGFIENYGDPLGLKSTWESVVNFKDMEATKRAEIISSNAQWFENNSPVDPIFRKKRSKRSVSKGYYCCTIRRRLLSKHSNRDKSA
jgi:dipeptidyl-peptidase III